MEPFIHSPDSKVAAFRLIWFGQDSQYLQDTWSHIVSLRTQIDQLVLAQADTMPFVISAITATQSAKLKGTSSGGSSQYRVYPAVSYFIVTENSGLKESDLFNQMQANRFGATMKLMLQPYQQDEKNIINELFHVVKDNAEGCVRRHVDISAQAHPQYQEGKYPIVIVYVKEGERSQHVQRCASNLCQQGFYMEVQHI